MSTGNTLNLKKKKKKKETLSQQFHIRKVVVRGQLYT